MWLLRKTASTPAAKSELRGFDVRGATPYGYVPNRADRAADQPGWHLRSARSQQSAVEPVHPGSDSGVWHCVDRRRHQPSLSNAEYRIPIVGSVMFSFFDDFGIDVVANHGQLKQSPEGFASLTAPALRLPGVQQRLLPGRHSGFAGRIPARYSPGRRAPTSCPACRWAGALGHHADRQCARSGIYYAYNPLRLYERPYCNDVLLGANVQSCSAQLITRDLFPPGGAGDYTYAAGHPGLRRAEPLPRTAQDLPPDGLDNLLDLILIQSSSLWPL